MIQKKIISEEYNFISLMDLYQMILVLPWLVAPRQFYMIIKGLHTKSLYEVYKFNSKNLIKFGNVVDLILS